MKESWIRRSQCFARLSPLKSTLGDPALHAEPDQADMARIETNLGDLLAKRGKLQESARLFRASLRGREKILPSNHPDIFDAKQSSAVSWVKKDVFRKRNRSCLTAWHGVDNKASDFNSPSKQRILNEIATCT